MRWLTASLVRRYRKRHGSIGDLWHGRFKAFPCQDVAHLLWAFHDVDRNALRAWVAVKADGWKFSSLFAGLNGSGKIEEGSSFLPRDADRTARVNRPMTEKELSAVRRSLSRGTPIGTKAWTSRTASQGPEPTHSPQRRPRK